MASYRYGTYHFYCLFRPNGQASCAYLYPDTVNGTPGRIYNAWANDQDWALDNYLIVMGSKVV